MAAKGYIGDVRFHPHREVEVDDPFDLFHIVATWPTAKCGADLSGREHRQRSVIAVANEGEPICVDCVHAEERERDAALEDR
jgi:hypothetical protein